MRVEFSPPDITEEEIAEVIDTLKSGWITTGPKTKKFEQEIAQFCGTTKAACLSSATTCMEMTLRAMGIGPGDEVITSAYTFTATCSVICHVGATPVLVDTMPDSIDMDPEKVREAITEKTKAILTIDLAGIIYPYYDRLFEIVEEKKGLFQPSSERQEKLGRILILADAAHAFGAEREGKKCGQIADITCFSFHAVKNLTTAEGGAVTWKSLTPEEDEALYKEYMLLTLHGQSKDALAKMKAGGWEHDIVAPYYKANMTDITASIGLAQMKRYAKILQRRRQLIERYDEAFRPYQVQVLNHYGEGSQSNGHLYLVRLNGKQREECNQIIQELAKAEIAANVHYKPLPLLTAYKNMGFAIEDFPNAYRMYENEISLPLHSCLTDEQQQYVIDTFQRLLREHGLC